MDHANGISRGFMDVAAKEIAHCGKAIDGCGTTFNPGAEGFRERFDGRLVRDGEHPELRVIGGGRLFGRRRGTLEAESHVGLSRADPDFTHKDIVDRYRVFALDRQGKRAACFVRLEMHHPLAVFGCGTCVFAVEPDRDFLALFGCSPDRHFNALLQHRTIGKERIRFYFGPSRVGNGKTRKEDRKEIIWFHEECFTPNPSE